MAVDRATPIRRADAAADVGLSELVAALLLERDLGVGQERGDVLRGGRLGVGLGLGLCRPAVWGWLAAAGSRALPDGSRSSTPVGTGVGLTPA